MSLNDKQRDGFEERLKRIKKGGANTMGEVHIGPKDEEKARKGKDKSTVQLKKKSHKKKKGSILVVPVALALGGLSMFVGQAASFHMFDEGGMIPVELPVEAALQYVPYAPFAFAALLALLFTWTFGMSTLVRKLAVIAGLGAVFWFEGDLIQQFPDVYTAMFSEAYVTTAPEPRLEDLINQATELAEA